MYLFPQVHGLHSFIAIDYFSWKLEIGLKNKWTKKIDIFPFLVLPLPGKH